MQVETSLSCYPFLDPLLFGITLLNRELKDYDAAKNHYAYEHRRPTPRDYHNLEGFIAQNSVREIDFTDARGGIKLSRGQRTQEIVGAGQRDVLSMANIVRRNPIRSWEMNIYVSWDLKGHEVNQPTLLANYYDQLGKKIAEIIRPNRSLCSFSIELGGAYGENGTLYNLANHPNIQHILERNKKNSLSNFAYCFFHKPKQVAATAAVITAAVTWPMLLKHIPLYITLPLPIAVYALIYFVLKSIIHCQRPAAVDFNDVLANTEANLPKQT